MMRIKERFPDRDILKLLGTARRLNEAQKKKLIRESPQALKQIQEPFTERYFLISANRHIFVIEPPSLVITCWDWYSHLKCNVADIDFLEKRKPKNGHFQLSINEYYALINTARAALE